MIAAFNPKAVAEAGIRAGLLRHAPFHGRSFKPEPRRYEQRIREMAKHHDDHVWHLPHRVVDGRFQFHWDRITSVNMAELNEFERRAVLQRRYALMRRGAPLPAWMPAKVRQKGGRRG